MFDAHLPDPIVVDNPACSLWLVQAPTRCRDGKVVYNVLLVELGYNTFCL